MSGKIPEFQYTAGNFLQYEAKLNFYRIGNTIKSLQIIEEIMISTNYKFWNCAIYILRYSNPCLELHPELSVVWHVLNS